VSQATSEMLPAIEDREWRRIFVPDGRVPLMGELFKQPDLARALIAIAQDGSDVFYKGWIAEAIVRRLTAEGFLMAEDLAIHSGEWGEPLAIDYRGHTIYEPPLPTPGLAVLLTLKLLEGFDLRRLGFQSAEHLHLMIEMAKLAYVDRERWLADPGKSKALLDELLSEEHANRRRLKFDPARAQPLGRSDPIGDTTGFVITDRYGNMISVIQSVFTAFGSGVVAESTGVVLHNRGSYFTTEPLHPNCFGPRKRPFHTLIAAIATKGNRPFIGFSAMGANGQAQQFHVQVLTNVLDFGLDIQEAIERPRFVIGPPGHAADLLWIEERIGRNVLGGLERLGHRIETVSDFFHLMGHAHGVVVVDSTLTGGADPRGDGLALGY
jgi:gamma-glutamyltranspeptidase